MSVMEIKIGQVLAAVQLISTTSLSTLIGTPAGASVSADVAAIKAVVDLIKGYTDTEVATIITLLGTPAGASLAADLLSAYNRVGAPSGASIAADILANYTRLGAPAGASHAADVAALQADSTRLQGRLVVTGPQSRLYPTLAAGQVLTGAAGANALGTVAQIMPASTAGAPFYVFGVCVDVLTIGAVGEIVLYHGAGDTEFARFSVPGATGVIIFPAVKQIADADRIRGAIATVAGGAQAGTFRILYHT